MSNKAKKPGDRHSKTVRNNNGSPVLAGLTVSTLGSKPGDTVEITYGADEIVIRRAGETAKVPRHNGAGREVVRGVRLGFPSMCAPGGDPTKIYGLTAVCISDGWAVSKVGRCAMRGLTEAQATAWCIDGVLPTDGGEG